jgi:tRNA nucleotidyltransferase/poly(A) polymerase
MSDYMFALESHLDAAQNRAVTEIQRIATEAAQTVWLTGGAMRDMLRGAPIRDLDFTVERDAVKVGRALAEALNGNATEEDSLKRWVELELPGGLRASVSNARTEKYSKPGGKPQIAPATIHEDLSRRDFTINAIALFLNRGAKGLLVDPTNGQADLINKELRTTNSMAFFDDPSRVFRLIRFRHILGFEVAARTQSQVDNAVLGDYLHPDPSALAADLRALAAHESAVAAIEDYERLGLLKLVSPALAGEKLNLAGLSRFEKQTHSVFPAGTEDGWLAFLTVLLEKISPKDRAAAIKALALPADEIKAFQKLEAGAKKRESALKSAKIHKPSQVWEVLRDADTSEVLMVVYDSGIRVVQDRIRAYYQKYLPAAQEVTEDLVAAAGHKPGTPKFTKAYEAMIVTRLNSRPKKVEPEPEPPPPPMSMGRGRPPARVTAQ